MKRGHIIAIILIIIGIGTLFSVFGDMAKYSTFAESSKNPNLVKVVGVLSKNKPVNYDPEVDPNYFSFHMKDQDGEEKEVVMNAAKPQDFAKSEKIVLTGKMRGDKFVASDMLLKCPSKYKDEEILVRSAR
ncbi:MAG: cytochrome c-type biogenesis protein CcmE [Maribacter sp.]|jgi:cytochrome c-type biogenesis protein CcmE